MKALDSEYVHGTLRSIIDWMAALEENLDMIEIRQVQALKKLDGIQTELRALVTSLENQEQS